jgi:hypothetical protein
MEQDTESSLPVQVSTAALPTRTTKMVQVSSFVLPDGVACVTREDLRDSSYDWGTELYILFSFNSL